MWESAVILVIVAVAAALLACRAKKTLSGRGGCGCKYKKAPRCTMSDTEPLPNDDTDEGDNCE